MSHQTLSLSLFVLFVIVTLGITIWASRQTKTAADFYSAGRRITGEFPAHCGLQALEDKGQLDTMCGAELSLVPG